MSQKSEQTSPKSSSQKLGKQKSSNEIDFSILADWKQKVCDEAFFFNLIRMPIEELKKLAEAGKAKKVDHETEIAGKLENLRQSCRSIQKLEIKLLQLEVDSEIQQEEFPKLAAGLNELQQIFNSNVDSFNNLKDKTGINKGAYQEVAKIYNDHSQKLDEYADESNQKLDEMDHKIQEARNLVAENQKLLDSASEDLAMKRELLSQTLEHRETLEEELNRYDVEGLKQQLQNLMMVQDEKQKELNNFQNKVKEAESKVHSANEKKIETDKNLEEIQNAVIKINDDNAILDQRIENEKKISDKMILAKFDKHEQRVRQANLNIVVELRNQMEKKVEIELNLEQLKLKNSKKIKDIETLKDIVAKKKKAQNEFADQIVKISDGNHKRQEEKNVLLHAIDDVKKMKDELKEEAGKSTTAYEKKIKKQKRKQTFFGVVDDDKSSKKSSDELESSLSLNSSSFSCTEIGQVEKMDINATVDSSLNLLAKTPRKYQ